jgi:hypothetical protein
MPRSFVCAFVLLCCCLPASSLQIRTDKLPWAVQGLPYQAQIDMVLDDRCIQADVSFALVAGTLPRGLALAGFGLEGTPREMGRFRFTIRAANECVSVVKTIELFVTGKPVLQVSTNEVTFEYHVGGDVPKPQAVLVASTWPNLPYSAVTNGAEWLRAAQTDGVTPDMGSSLSGDSVIIRVNPEKLASGIYRTTLVFTTWMGANTPEISVTLKIVKE